jgi:hypothetical protein
MRHAGATRVPRAVSFQPSTFSFVRAKGMHDALLLPPGLYFHSGQPRHSRHPRVGLFLPYVVHDTVAVGLHVFFM